MQGGSQKPPLTFTSMLILVATVTSLMPTIALKLDVHAGELRLQTLCLHSEAFACPAFAIFLHSRVVGQPVPI